MRSAIARGGFTRREGLQRQCVDLAAHAIAQRLVDELMPLQLPKSGKSRTGYSRLEMHVVFRADNHVGAWQTGTDQCLNLLWIHVWPVLAGMPAGDAWEFKL